MKLIADGKSDSSFSLRNLTFDTRIKRDRKPKMENDGDRTNRSGFNTAGNL